MRILLGLFTVSFFMFICWVINSANAGFEGIIFHWVKPIPYGDKLFHFALYALLALLLNLTLQGAVLKTSLAINCNHRPINIMLGSALVFLFSLLEEISQFVIPARTPDMGDVLANLLGVYVAARMAGWWLVRLERPAIKDDCWRE